MTSNSFPERIIPPSGVGNLEEVDEEAEDDVLYSHYFHAK
jgi:hypothetical protein